MMFCKIVGLCVCVCVCVCMCARLYVYERERQIEKKGERERCMSMSVCGRLKDRAVYVCVCTYSMCILKMFPHISAYDYVCVRVCVLVYVCKCITSNHQMQLSG